MTQQNEAIRLAELRMLVRRLAIRLPTDDRVRLQALDYLRRTFSASEILRDDEVEAVGQPEQSPLLDQTSDGVGEERRIPEELEAWIDSFPVDNAPPHMPNKWKAKFYAMEEELKRLRALTRADQPADKDERQEALKECPLVTVDGEKRPISGALLYEWFMNHKKTLYRALSVRREGRVMRLVILESPYAGDVPRNLAYAHDCVRDCLRRGESPYASHIMLTTATDDTIPEQRSAGINAGLCWAARADAVVVYTDHGITPGMIYAIDTHQTAGRKIEYRSLAKDEDHG